MKKDAEKIVSAAAIIILFALPFIVFPVSVFATGPSVSVVYDTATWDYSNLSGSYNNAYFYIFASGVSLNNTGYYNANSGSESFSVLALPTLSPGTYTIISGISNNDMFRSFNDGYCGTGQSQSNCESAAQNVMWGPGNWAENTFVVSGGGGGGATIPDVATTDIGAVGGPVLGSMITSFEYTLETFGPQLYYILACIAIFVVIYYAIKNWGQL